MSITIGALFLIGNNVFADFSTPGSGAFDHSAFEDRKASCITGGCGASSCTYTESVGVWLLSISINVSTSCQEGYHACCGFSSAECLPPSACSELNDAN